MSEAGRRKMYTNNDICSDERRDINQNSESNPLPTSVPTYDEMTEDDFNQMLAKGLEQIERGETVSMEEVFKDFDF